jgi:hypothetical protein
VISRIEANIVRHPDDRTLTRISVALGRSARVLYFVAEEPDALAAMQEIDVDLPVLQEARAEWAREEAKAVVDDAAVREKWEGPIFDALVEHFVEHRVTDELAPDVDPARTGPSTSSCMHGPG